MNTIYGHKDGKMVNNMGAESQQNSQQYPANSEHHCGERETKTLNSWHFGLLGFESEFFNLPC
jgi:hypothetical protein